MVVARPADPDQCTPAAPLAGSRRFGFGELAPSRLHRRMLLLLSGIVMAAQAFAALGSSLSPLPAAKQENRLICQGPYQRCRHPMYQAVLLCSLGVVLVLGQPCSPSAADGTDRCAGEQSPPGGTFPA